jgi:ABC-type oligopeptide transport system substrate-binding subunit
VQEANSQFKTEADRQKIAEYSAIAQTELMSDIILVPLYERPYVEVVRNTLKGRKMAGNTVPQWWNITQWHFEKWR